MLFTSLRWLLIASGLLLGAATVQAQVKPVNNSLAALLKASRWQKRVLLLCAPSATDAALVRQRQLLASAQPALDARALLVHEVLLSNLSAADKTYLAENLRVSSVRFVVLLIGKDGGVKRRETAPVSPTSLFKTIDVMPMRQQEMRKN